MDNQGQMTAKQAAAQARYQEVAKKLHSSAKKQFPSRKITQIKFVQVTTPAGVVPGQRVNLTGAIQDRNLSIVIPTGAREGRQFEVPYILFDDAAEGEDDIFVGDPFFVFPPLLSPAEADEDAVRQLIREAYETDPDNALNPTAWKERGNAEFKQHNYREAVRFYGAAVAAGLETVRAKHPAATNSDAGQAQTELAKQLDVHIAYSNKALALLKLKPPRAEEALQACEAALGIDPTYSKALFRAGQCLEKVSAIKFPVRNTLMMHAGRGCFSVIDCNVFVNGLQMGRPGDALAAYTEAQKLKPGDKAISKALAKCKRIVEAREAPSIPNSVPQSTTATGGSKTTNSAVTQKKTPLGQLYSDKQVTKKFDWGPIPANGEYNAGYLESGMFSPHAFVTHGAQFTIDRNDGAIRWRQGCQCCAHGTVQQWEVVWYRCSRRWSCRAISRSRPRCQVTYVLAWRKIRNLFHN